MPISGFVLRSASRRSKIYYTLVDHSTALADVVGRARRSMVQQLLSDADLDTIMQWRVMQRFMDELSETEDDTGSSDKSDDLARIRVKSRALGDAAAPA